MTEWVSWILDAILICVVGAGMVQAMRLIRQLRDLKASRVEMERFVREFNGAVIRAEAGIKGLRAAARDSGDDLEKLVEKAVMIRDELNFIVDSADSVAERLSTAASTVLNTERAVQAKRQEQAQQPQAQAPQPQPQQGQQGQPAAAKPASSAPAKPAEPPAAATPSGAQPASRAEKELLQALQKLS